MGGGDTSCCHNESERSDRKGELFDMSSGGIDDGGAGESGKMRSRYGDIVSCSSLPSRSGLRSKGGYVRVSVKTVIDIWRYLVTTYKSC